jgi:DNA (cytosine-5)-methyltransferase 1
VGEALGREGCLLMTTISTIFSGGEGVGVGARMAGLVHLWGIEIDDSIAQVARDNHFDTITADVLTVDPRHLQVPDILHASPVCTRASVANAEGEESELDIDAAKKTAEFITVMRPKYFMLENVYPYRHFQSFKLICDALRQTGYSFDYWHLNSADYGVPQTRRRLVLVARLDGGNNRIKKPIPTHHNPTNINDNQMTLFAPNTKSWVGWYEAVEDLIPFLPESKFAPWQLERLPDDIRKTFVFEPTEMREAGIRRDYDDPIYTIKATRHLNARTFIIDQLNGSHEKSTERNYKEPIFTTSIYSTKHPVPRAFFVGDQQRQLRQNENPAVTVRSGENGGEVPRAWLSQGYVVKMTPRALARFQSFPDWYRLPNKNSLAVKIAGNAVPPRLACRVIECALGQ